MPPNNNIEAMREEWMNTKMSISLDNLPPEMITKALGTLHVQMANSVGREPSPQEDYLSYEDIEKINKIQTADWWLSKFSDLQRKIEKMEISPGMMSYGNKENNEGWNTAIKEILALFTNK